MSETTATIATKLTTTTAATATTSDEKMQYEHCSRHRRPPVVFASSTWTVVCYFAVLPSRISFEFFFSFVKYIHSYTDTIRNDLYFIYVLSNTYLFNVIEQAKTEYGNNLKPISLNMNEKSKTQTTSFFLKNENKKIIILINLLHFLLCISLHKFSFMWKV